MCCVARKNGMNKLSRVDDKLPVGAARAKYALRGLQGSTVDGTTSLHLPTSKVTTLGTSERPVLVAGTSRED